MTSEDTLGLYPDPGPLPTLPPPTPGDVVEFRVEGYPPTKDRSFSIRNVRHPKYPLFLALRQCAVGAMDGRAWYEGPIKLELTLHAPKLQEALLDYFSGIEDTLDGSHGFTFTYLPVVYQDDCQVCESEMHFQESPNIYYDIRVTFHSRSRAGRRLNVPAGCGKSTPRDMRARPHP